MHWDWGSFAIGFGVCVVLFVVLIAIALTRINHDADEVAENIHKKLGIL